MKTTEVKKYLANQYLVEFPVDSASVLNSLSTEEILGYLEALPPDTCGEILQGFHAHTNSKVLEDMSDELFIRIFDELDAYIAAILISRIRHEFVEKKLALLSKGDVKIIQELLNYPPNTAGHLMDTRILTFDPSLSCEEVLNDLRNIGDQTIATVYVVDHHSKLVGKVPLQTVAISDPDRKLNELAVPSPSIPAMALEEDIVTLFQDGKFLSLPVTDHENRMIGIIRNDALIAATQKDAAEDVLAMFGAGREEQALSSPWFAIRKRLPWLQINLATAFLAASIVGIFEDTIAKITVLAVFLPVVAGQSGNTGSQALAVTMRGLALREIHTKQWWKVAKKEVLVGFINGLAVAFTTSIIVYFWASSFGLALVIGTSMVLSMVIAGFSGAVVPIMLKAFGQDPAQSSSIVLTTVTDIMGFLSFLGLATALGGALGIF